MMMRSGQAHRRNMNMVRLDDDVVKMVDDVARVRGDDDEHGVCTRSQWAAGSGCYHSCVMEYEFMWSI